MIRLGLSSHQSQYGLFIYSYIKRFLNNDKSRKATKGICRLLPNREKIHYTFLDPHLYLYTKFYKTCSLLTAQFSTNIPRPHLLYNLVKALHAVASCITSSGINRGSCVQHYVALDGSISTAKKILLRWRWKLPHYTNLTSLLRFLYKRVKQGFGYKDGSSIALHKKPSLRSSFWSAVLQWRRRSLLKSD